MNLAHLVPSGHRDLGDEDRLAQALRNAPPIPEDKKQETARIAAELVRQARTSTLRNAAAILLTDLLGKSAAADIVDVLQRPEIAKSSGSLLFALNEAGASLPLGTAIRLIEQGSLEAQGEALTFMEEARIDPFTSLEFDGAKERLISLKAMGGGPNAHRAAVLALEFLQDLHPQ